MTGLAARGHVVPRRGDGAFRGLTRWLLLFFWALILWGSLLFLALLASVVSDGPAVAFSRLDPRFRPGLVPWINAAATLLAPIVWTSAIVLLAPRKRD